MASDAITYDKGELRDILKSFKAMDDQAISQAREKSSELARYAADRIKEAAGTRTVAATAVQRVADGVSISKSSKVGEFSYGFARQKFSGGATTQMLWAGLEFGSNRYKQFPARTPSKGRGNTGYFIYPTLKKIQPELIQQWEETFSKIAREWDK
jgi:hypothetical protein